jgi:hypothetical protein
MVIPASCPMDSSNMNKMAVLEVKYSSLSGAEFKKAFSRTSTPLHVCMACCLLKHEGQLYVYVEPPELSPIPLE